MAISACPRTVTRGYWVLWVARQFPCRGDASSHLLTLWWELGMPGPTEFGTLRLRRHSAAELTCASPLYSPGERFKSTTSLRAISAECNRTGGSRRGFCGP